MSIVRTLLEFLDVPVAASWTLTPDQALDFLQSKGLRTSFDYRDMMGAEHARAFTVAKMMDADLLADVKASLDDALANGVPFKAWADSIVPTLQAKGWWGRKSVVDPLTGQTIVAGLGSPSRLQTIYRTNMQSAYAAGAWDAIVDQADLAPFLLYDALDDHRTREEHAAWDGTVLPITDSWWSTHYPPNGWNCRCSVIQLSQDDLDDLGLEVSKYVTGGGTYTWTNPRTGKTQQIPTGIDPGWNHNVGVERAKQLAKTAADKLKGYPEDLQAAAAKGFSAAAEAGKAVAGAAEQAMAASARKAAQLAMAAEERTAAMKVAQALNDKTPYLAKSIKDVLKTKGAADLPKVELLAKAQAQAFKLEQQTALSDWKKAYVAGKTPPDKAAAAFGALPADQAAALVQQLDLAKAAAAAEKAAAAKLDDIVLGSSKTLEGKALEKLMVAGKVDTMTKVELLAAVEADVAAAKAVQIAGQTKAGLKKALVAEKLPTQAQQDYLKSLAPADLDAFLKEVEAAKLAAKVEAPPIAGLAAKAPAAETITPGTTLDPAKLTQIGPQKGSNPGGLYRDESTGVTWYVKTPPSLAHAQNEVLAAKLYQAAGIDVPELRLTTLNGKPAVASRIVDGLSKVDPATLATADGVMDGFVVDAWLANWDVVGATFDNLLTKGWGVVRVDTGGALLFRAQGAAKGAMFGDTVTELKTFLDATKNPNTAKVFGKITSEQLEASAKRVLAITDDDIRALVAAHGPAGELGETLAKRLIARKADLAKQFGKATEAFNKAKLQAIEAAEFAAREGLAEVDGAILTAIKGIAKRAADGVPLEAKDIQRAADAGEALTTWLKTHIPVLGVDSVAEVRAYYVAWLDTLDDAVSAGAGKPAKWAGAKFEGFKGPLGIDSSKVTVTLPPEGLTFSPQAAKAAITKALGSSAANLNVPDNSGAAALKGALPLEHQRAVTAYTGSYYRQVNDALRAGTADAATRAYADLLNEALALAPKYVGEVTRGLTLSGGDLARFLADHRQALVTGQGVVHRGFISTSQGGKAAFGGNVVLHIKSTTGVNVAPISLHASEREILLRHGTRFAVTDLKETGGKYHVYLQEVGP